MIRSSKWLAVSPSPFILSHEEECVTMSGREREEGLEQQEEQ